MMMTTIITIIIFMCYLLGIFLLNMPLIVYIDARMKPTEGDMLLLYEKLQLHHKTLQYPPRLANQHLATRPQLPETFKLID